MEVRRDTTGPPTKDSFWPFRTLSGNEEAEVLRNMKDHQDADPPPKWPAGGAGKLLG